MKLEPPEKELADDIHALTKGVLSCMPGVGGLVAEFFSIVVTPPLDHRRQEWMRQIAHELAELRKQADNFSWEQLRDDEQFLDVFLHATQVALRNHQAEKLVALRNAVCNTALKIDIEDVHKTMFLRYVDELTVLHLTLLDLLNNPPEWEQKNGRKFPTCMGGGIEHIIYHAVPELSQQRQFTQLLVKDLQSRGLLVEFSFGATMTWNGIMSARGTDMGGKFVQFISEPRI